MKSLRKRIFLLLSLKIVILLLIFIVIGYFSIHQSINLSLEERLLLSRFAADKLETNIQEQKRILEAAAGEIGRDGGSEKTAGILESLFKAKFFTNRVFLIDADGNPVLSYPPGNDQLYENFNVRKFLKEENAVSNVIFIGPRKQPVVALGAPVRDEKGETRGALFGEIDLTENALLKFLHPIKLGKSGTIEVVDGNGVVLASTKIQDVLKESDHGNFLSEKIRLKEETRGRCHRCHEETTHVEKETEVMTFSPLTGVNWGISIRQSESEALAPANKLMGMYFAIGVAFMALTFFISFFLTRSIFRPVKQLTAASERIASGDMETPVKYRGTDEIGRLAASFEAMRIKLKESMESIRQWTAQLEKNEEFLQKEVERRTHELQLLNEKLREKDTARTTLIKKVISAQEDERKRIARELHDSTSQELAAVIMQCDLISKENLRPETREKVEYFHHLLVKLLDDTRLMIYDLRPSILDDLGLEAALRWLVDTRLAHHGISVSLEIEMPERKLRDELETALFRIYQENISNIIKHSEARNVIITLSAVNGRLKGEVEDDGRGFDVAEVMTSRPSGRGLGLLGMRERIELLGGELTIESEAGAGTRVTFLMPFIGE
ncbi:MAG: HAMP domain-containing protein, partial [Deltaproteobacteria bacterium]|nr:HAMP domain-containing protein [Deltaproteobacteria bacterium]